MAMTENLLIALKKLFRVRGITYKDAALALDLSEVSVKRLFSECNCSLARFEKLCELAGTDIGELLVMVESQQQQLTQLSVQQEQILVSDTRLLLVAVCIINHWHFDEILAKYNFSTPQLTRLFTTLDKLGIISLLPGNRYHLKIARSFSWQSHGPIQSYFVQSILQDYLKSSVQNSGNHFRLVWGMLTKESAEELNRKIHRLIDEYLQIAEQDRRIPVSEKMTSSLLVMFREDWEPQIFQQEMREI